MKPLSLDGAIRSAKLQTVIVVQTVYGKGTEDDRVRSAYEYWSLDGDLLAVRVPSEPIHQGSSDA